VAGSVKTKQFPVLWYSKCILYFGELYFLLNIIYRSNDECNFIEHLKIILYYIIYLSHIIFIMLYYTRSIVYKSARGLPLPQYHRRYRHCLLVSIRHNSLSTANYLDMSFFSKHRFKLLLFMKSLNFFTELINLN